MEAENDEAEEEGAVSPKLSPLPTESHSKIPTSDPQGPEATKV